jgi:hypothetical protein
VSTITANSNLHSVLSQVKDVTEIRDAHGNLMGIYTPKGHTDAGINSQRVLILFEDGRSVQFDLKQARERLATELAMPFREMIDRHEKPAEQKG